MSDPSDLFLDADHRTLRLAVPEIAAELIQRFLRYEAAFLSVAEAGPPDEARLSSAHHQGLNASQLNSEIIAQMSAVVRAYAGTVSVLRRVETRLDEVRRAAEQGDAAAQERLAKLRIDHAKYASMAELASRYGRTTIELLDAHRDALVDGHERTARVLTPQR